MKNTINDIIKAYTMGELSLEEANRALKEAGCIFHFAPGRHELTEEEKQATTVGYYPEQANGFGLLDTGTGTMEKVAMTDGTLAYAVNQVREDGSTNMLAFVYICGKRYEVKGRRLATHTPEGSAERGSSGARHKEG